MNLAVSVFYILLMFCSGGAALIYQVIWQRVLSQEVGLDSTAVAIVVAVFMIGLGFGSLYGGRFTRRYPQLLPLIYALMEACIGAYGWFSNPILRQGNQFTATLLVPNPLLDFLVNLVLLIAPVFLMGMSTPVIMDMLKRSLSYLGRLIGVFYGANILGAAFGALVCGLYMIETFGLSQSARYAAMINGGIAAAALLIAPFWYITRHRGTSTKATGQPPATIARRYIYAAFCFGFTTLAAQMILFRILFYIYTPLPTLFPVILSAYLIMMAAGEYIAGYLCDRARDHITLQRMGYLLMLGAMLSFTAVATIPVEQMASKDFMDDIRHTWIYIAAFMIPIAFLAGYFPLLLKIITRELKDVAPNFGFILGISTLGNVLGVFITTTFLFALLGTWGSTLLTFLVALAGCIWINDDAYEAAARQKATPAITLLRTLPRQAAAHPWVVLVAGAFLLMIAALPYRFYSQPFDEFKPLWSIEGRTGIVTAVPFTPDPEKHAWLYTSRQAAARASRYEPSGLQQITLSRLMVLDHDYRPKKIAQIGIGNGLFVYANKELPFLERIDVVEISSEVITAWRKYSKVDSLKRVFEHPKVHLHIIDGRRFLRQAVAAGEQYDIIQIGIQHPSANGASNLYTAEMFALAKRALKPEGYLVLIGYAGLARTALESFHTVFWMAQDGCNWVFATDKNLDDLPDTLTVPIDPWLAKLYSAGTVSDMALSDLDGFTRKKALRFAPFSVYVFDRQWLKSTYDVNRDDRLIYEYNLLARRKENYVYQNPFFAEMKYQAKETRVTVVDGGRPPAIPKTYEDLFDTSSEKK